MFNLKYATMSNDELDYRIKSYETTKEIHKINRELYLQDLNEAFKRNPSTYYDKYLFFLIRPSATIEDYYKSIDINTIN